MRCGAVMPPCGVVGVVVERGLRGATTRHGACRFRVEQNDTIWDTHLTWGNVTPSPIRVHTRRDTSEQMAHSVTATTAHTRT